MRPLTQAVMRKKTMTDSLSKEVQRFRDWAASYPMELRSGEWECDYEHWKELNSSFDDYLALNKPNEATIDEISDLIYAVARDNEMEELIDSVSENPEWFRRLLTEVLRTNEHDAKWQFAVALGKGILPSNEAEPPLLKMVEDKNEYLSRMALQSLGRIGSTYAESYCERAWASNLEYQRIMALWVLKKIGSKKLSDFIKLAKEDGRKYVVQKAHEVESA